MEKHESLKGKILRWNQLTGDIETINGKYFLETKTENGEYVEIILKSDVKSAVHGLLEEIDEMIEWYEENRKEDYHIFTAKRDTALRIKTKIKKWFPDVVEDKNKGGDDNAGN